MGGFLTLLSLLMPTFALHCAPEILTVFLPRGSECSPTIRPEGQIHSFGSMLDARLLSMPDRSTSELLRTL